MLYAVYYLKDRDSRLQLYILKARVRARHAELSVVVKHHIGNVSAFGESAKMWPKTNVKNNGMQRKQD